MAAKRIVILGGGFGGVYTALYLEKLLRPDEAEICLVNRENYFVFQPLLSEVVSGAIGILDTVVPIRRICRRTMLYVREVENVDLERRVVTLAPTFVPRHLELEFDYLVVASGTLTNLGGLPGLAEHAIPFKTLGDALRLRNRVIQVMEEADTEPDPEVRRKLLTFVVGGGGFSGVEVLADVNDFVRGAARSFQTIKDDEIRCILVHSGERILPEMPARLAEYAQRVLARRGVELRLNTRVTAATADSVVMKEKGGQERVEHIPARTLVSTVPSGPVPIVQEMRCAKEKGRLLVNTALELQGHEGRVWALGDCAQVVMANGEPAPPTAQHAIREAKCVADNISAAMRGAAKRQFLFPGLGKMGALGHRSAVAEVFGMRFSGFFAWVLWRGVYWMKMPGLDRKVRVGLDWLVSLLFPPDLVQLRTQSAENIVTEHFEPGEVIFHQGDLGTRLFVISKGQVEVLREGQRVATLETGAYFGEMALLSNAPRGATIRAVQPTDVLAIERGDANKLMAHFPEFKAGLAKVAAQRQGE